MKCPAKVNLQRQQNSSFLVLAEGEVSNCKWAQRASWGQGNVPELNCGDGCTTL